MRTEAADWKFRGARARYRAGERVRVSKCFLVGFVLQTVDMMEYSIGEGALVRNR